MPCTAKSPLSAERRKNSLYFHHQYRVDDDVTLEVPAGYAIEALPSSRTTDLGGLTFKAEYLYLDFPAKDFLSGTNQHSAADAYIHTFRLGANWQFH